MEKSQTAGYYLLLRNYVHSPFRDFESYLRTLTGLNGDDFQLILKQYKSKFITYQIPQALIHLRICLQFFQEVLITNLKSEHG